MRISELSIFFFYNVCNRLTEFNTGKYDAIISQNLSIHDFVVEVMTPWQEVRSE
jgi:hypothetical protein